jgi:mannose-6-phosphate isomerase-like protein (cupin superfamily)
MKQGKNFIHNYFKCDSKNEKIFIGKQLELTGSEISINHFNPRKGSSFLHAHKRNEEVYIITKGAGSFYIDGEEFPVSEGSIVKVKPEGIRAIKADNNSELNFICIQTDSNSLKQATREDGVISQKKTSWM